MSVIDFPAPARACFNIELAQDGDTLRAYVSFSDLHIQKAFSALARAEGMTLSAFMVAYLYDQIAESVDEFDTVAPVIAINDNAPTGF